MTDGYWNRQQPPPSLPSNGMLKRSRSDYATNEMQNYYDHDDDDDRCRYQIVKDTKTIGSAYDRYLQNAQAPPFAFGQGSALGGGGLGRSVSSGMTGRLPIVDHRQTSPVLASNGREIGYGDQRLVDSNTRSDRETQHLPPDASNTLYVEGFPPDCSRREVAHIFRPFVGYKEVRLVSKESRQRGGDPIILCFVDFADPACAATAMSALQGYKIDEQDPDSKYLRLQFSRHPGPRSGSINRGRR